MVKPIYLDYNGTTPIDREAAELMAELLREGTGNPSSSHYYGVQARDLVEDARNQVAGLIGAESGELIFTSGGTEANNLAIRGMLKPGKDHIVISSTEHLSVSEVCRDLENNGYKVSRAPVDKYGVIILSELENLLTAETALVSIMHSNNETGTIQPVKQISELCSRNNIPFHTDASQSVGKVTIDVNDLGVDLLTIAGHKFYAPQGSGGLYVREGIEPERVLFGANQEKGLSPGTENVLAIAALGKAAAVAKEGLKDYQPHLLNMREMLYEGLQQGFEFLGLPDDFSKLNGHPEKRLPNTLNISLRNFNAKKLSSLLFEKVAFSTGAACHSAGSKGSKVLKAMGVPDEYLSGTMRFSTGKQTKKEEIEQAVELIVEGVKRLSEPDSTGSFFFKHKAEQRACDSRTRSSQCSAVKEGQLISTAKEEEIKLTHFTAGLGCACKIEPSVLEAVVKQIPVLADDKVLVGAETSDDAAVYKISDDKAVVLTLDFFNPIVDDPYHFGSIAAANSLSDIYAMGAVPLFALNIVGFPLDKLPAEVLTKILIGAADKAQEANIPILGGHSIKDVEPKYGLAVAGIIHPDKLLTNNKARPQDSLVLTKPLGIGILTSALKKGLATEKEKQSAIETMAQLNKPYAENLAGLEVHACTDITGFGLLGHLSELLSGSSVDATINFRDIPQLEGLYRLIDLEVTPGGIFSNMDFYGKKITWNDNIKDADKYILFDAQTSGGLLISMPAAAAEKYVTACRKQGLKYAGIIGQVTTAGNGRIQVD